MARTPNSRPHMDTSQRINHVFGCSGSQMHIMPGVSLLKAGDTSKCPTCGATVQDITGTLVGQAYIAFARLDLGDKP
jgi:hypothetical protein